MLKKNEVRRLIRSVLESDGNVLLAYLFGSTGRNAAQPLSDVDIAVLLKDSGLERQADILWKVAKALRVPEDKIDVVDLSQAGLHLKYNILKEGVKIVDKGFERGLVEKIVEEYPEARENLNILVRTWLKEDPKINQAVILRRLDEVLRNAAFIRERYAHKPLEWVLEDPERTLALERSLERIIEAMMDACRHIVSAKRLGIIETYAEYPLRLAQHELMPKDLADKIAELIKLRNILAHRYLEIDYAKLREKAEETAEQTAPKFADWIKKFFSQK
ncbi:MAG: HepT-like ribonuclease domain-containing protein [Candidatus Bathyarchaeia archaeon]